MPKRIQLKRTKGWRKPANTVVVSRPSKWGNEAKVGERIGAFITDHKRAVDYYEKHVLPDLLKRHDITELKGKNLACWCPPGSACHADVLLRLANQ
ncbi:DUF4326 domain-containing protein [Hyphococcus sp.]|uniref:DUF4326 domain-containing protein n=1 Tax=Hyphococcus sp. TaxID=2038636 RepID=UPI00208ABFB6|nr:MAG: hypothetical protein DHS20C04_27330 [Marinicaulis sp.]